MQIKKVYLLYYTLIQNVFLLIHTQINDRQALILGDCKFNRFLGIPINHV